MISKFLVVQFWENASCGETAYAKGPTLRARMLAQSEIRYELEPYIAPFACFEEANGKNVLEIGVGMGADHQRWAIHNPSLLCGIDLTHRAIEWTRQRIEPIQDGVNVTKSELLVADAERLPFNDATFDIVYSWGVLHHSPDTAQCFREIFRVLRSGGIAKIMIYHKWSIVGVMLWLKFGLRYGMSLTRVYERFLESPGTKAYTVHEAEALCRQARLTPLDIKIELSSGDLLQGAAGQRYESTLMRVIKILWPRFLLRVFCRKFGLFMLISAKKT